MYTLSEPAAMTAESGRALVLSNPWMGPTGPRHVPAIVSATPNRM
jgi:hypothetical protein